MISYASGAFSALATESYIAVGISSSRASVGLQLDPSQTGSSISASSLSIKILPSNSPAIHITGDTPTLSGEGNEQFGEIIPVGDSNGRQPHHGC